MSCLTTTAACGSFGPDTKTLSASTRGSPSDPIGTRKRHAAGHIGELLRVARSTVCQYLERHPAVTQTATAEETAALLEAF